MSIVNYQAQAMRAIVRRESRPNDPAHPCQEWWDQYVDWELVDDLLGGTTFMRAKCEKWLPRERAEEKANYSARLGRSVLYGALRDTVEKLASKPFSRTVTVKGADALDEALQGLEDACDDEGRDLTQFAAEAFSWMVSHGKVHVLVDFPEEPPAGRTAADKPRPVFKLIAPEDMIGWRYERKPGGTRELTQIRFREWAYEKVGAYGTAEKLFVWVWNSDGTWLKFDATTGSGAAKKVASGRHTFPGIPIVTAYAKKVGYMMSEPPLKDLAQMNLAHWQSFSDQRNILRFGRMAMIYRTGVSKAEANKQVEVSPQFVFSSVNEHAKFGYVEPTGAALEAGAADLKTLEDRMEILGLSPLTEASADKTATGQILDEGKNETAIQTWVRSLERALRDAYGLGLQWINGGAESELPEDFSIDIFSDFGIATSSTAVLDFLLRCRVAGEMTRPFFLKEVKRRGVYAPDVDPEDEAAAAEAAAPDLADIGQLGGGIKQGGGPPAPGGKPQPKGGPPNAPAPAAAQ